MQKIMFNDRFLLTKAVLEGRKTQTRMFVKYPIEVRGEGVGYYHYYRNECCIELRDENEFPFSPEAYVLPRYGIGEAVAVAQSYKDASVHFEDIAKEANILNIKSKCKGYKNKMFVKPDLMPHQIKITDVRLQRLQEITDEECHLEGIEKEERTDGGYNYIFFDAKRELYIRERTPRDAYARLIDALSGKGTWESNPYVFAYDFDLVK